MEANTKQQQLTFDKGITNVPSDAICSDNSLEESVGMVYENGEHRVIQDPASFITSAVDENGVAIYIKLLYVHKLNDEERYIAVRILSTDGVVYYYPIWGTKEDNILKKKGDIGEKSTEIPNITSIGKTLIVSDNDSIYYYLWENNTYKYLGDIIPEPKIEFKMQATSERHLFVNNNLKTTSISVHDSGYITINEGKQEEYNNLVIGLYEENLKEIKNLKYFAEPFAIRYALELYDGSFSMQSAPIMLFPAISRNTYGHIYSDECELITYYARLLFNASFDYSGWEDIIKDVVVFASDGIKIYDTSVDQSPRTLNSSMFCCDFIASEPNDSLSKYRTSYITSSHEASGGNRVFLPLSQRGEEEVFYSMEEISVFYKIFSLGRKGNGEWEHASKYIREHTLENLTTQEQLPDDYYSHTTKTGKNIFSYNYRLLLSNVSRGFYEGESTFLPYDNEKSYDYHIYVYIRTQGEERIVKKELSTYEKIGNYFFYPDPRAYKAEVFFADGSHVATLELKEHPFLNGAYCFDHLPDGTEGEPTADDTGIGEPKENTTPELLNNQVWVSEVNNPFVFKAEGNITIGNGNIIGISSLTQALSQGQFGQYPLIIFTDEGIWAASTGTTGLFTAIHPMSREVCNNPDSITQTDGAVFFTSEKGLMVVAGSDVRCVSEQLSGKSEIRFHTYLKDAFIAYDYRDSLLWIFNPNKQSSTIKPIQPTNHIYIYSIKSGTFSRYNLKENVVTNVVNNYPDYLIQAKGGEVYSLTERTNINDDETDYEAFIITRPMKLENSLALKSIRQIRHITDMQGTLKLRIFASNNLRHWAELHSLRGTPWKYFRFRYDFQNLKATDRFSGSIVVTQERRTDKLR